MTLRLPLTLALVGLISLSACDSGSDTDAITGTWSTTVDYKADTVLANQNFRIEADYSNTYTFELLNEDGLIYGRITSSVEGTMTAREAGAPPIVVPMDTESSTTDYLFGTYDDPALEMDVLSEAYAANLWTFEKVGGRAELAGQVVHQWTFLSRQGEFSFTIYGDQGEKTTIRRDNREAPTLPDPATVVESTSSVHNFGEGSALLNRVSVEAR